MFVKEVLQTVARKWNQYFFSFQNHFQTFKITTYRCMTENERYGGKDYVEKGNKGS